MKNVVPSPETVTLKWIFENIPILWIYSIVAFLLALFLSGFSLGKFSVNTMGGDLSEKIKLKDELQMEISQLEIKKSNINLEIALLEQKRKSSEKSIDEIRSYAKENYIKKN